MNANSPTKNETAGQNSDQTESEDKDLSTEESGTPVPQLQSTPKLSSRGLTIMLGSMCVITLSTIFALLLLLPPPEQKGLKAEITPINFMPAEYFKQPFDSRKEPAKQPSIRVTNKGEHVWTLMNIRINGAAFQTYEKIPLPPGGERVFVLNNFWSLNGSRFNPRALKVRRIQIMARVKSRSRRTFTQHFDGDVAVDPPPKK